LDAQWERKGIHVKRRSKWLLGLGIGIPLSLLALLALVLRLTSPSPESALSSVEVRDLPQAWIEEPARIEEEPEDAVADTEPIVKMPSIESIGLPLSGILAIQGNGRTFGEESYMLTLDADGVTLKGKGEFWFKVLLATIRARFEQTLRMSLDLQPQALVSSFDAPLGFSRDIEASIGGSLVTVRSGDEDRTYQVSSDRVFVLNTFATYAVIPLLFALHPVDKPVDLQTLMLGGPPSQGGAEPGKSLPVMTVERIDDGVVRFDGRDLAVSRYLISSETGTMTLYARGAEFLGLFAGNGDESLFVYRADYFKGGFEIPD
jgi:hypothetical protein